MNLRNFLIIFFSYVFFFFIVFLYDNSIQYEYEWAKAILGPTTFVFSIILGFTITNRKNRLESVRTSLKEGDAALLDIFHFSKVFGNKIHEEIKDLLDEYMMSTLDYRLIDFEMSVPKLQNLLDYIIELTPRSKKEDFAKNNMTYELRNLMKYHKDVNHWANETMDPLKQAGLFILGSVIVFIMIILDDNSGFSTFITPLITTALVLILIVVRDLNSLRWKEKHWIWYPLIELYKEMNLVPYIPEPVLRTKRIKRKDLKHLKSYRIAYYKSKYPCASEDKVIKIFKNN